MYVGGINCSKQNAYEEMLAVQKRFGMKGKVVAYHGIQSFKTGEVTPEEAFEIGKETARWMWGDRYQVLVTVHLNTDNLHCHFVVNPCSFVDGQKFKNKIGDHLELRNISDEVCRRHKISVLENSNFYSKEKKAYWVEKNGKQSHRSMLKADVEYCIRYAWKGDMFFSQLRSLGYEIDYTRLSVKAPNWERPVRLSSIGYTREVIEQRLQENLYKPSILSDWNIHLPYKPKQFPLEGILKQLEFEIEHTYDTATVLVNVLFYVVLVLFDLASRISDFAILSPELRHEVKDIKQYVSDYALLQNKSIHTIPQLQHKIADTEKEIAELEHKRSLVDNKNRRANPEEKQTYKAERHEITEHITPLRKKLKQYKSILEKSPHLYELIQSEHKMEKEKIRSYERVR